MTADWTRVRQDYCRGAGVAELASKWGLSQSTIRRHIRKEGWTREGERKENMVEDVQKDEQMKLRARRVDDLADRMLGCLERAVAELDTVTKTVREKVKKEDGTDVTTDYVQVLSGEPGLIDRGGLKQLTGVLKDLKEVLGICSEEDRLEKEARIQKLGRDLQSMENSILVTMEGGCEHYAD